MRPSRDAIVFAAGFAVFSVVLGWAFWSFQASVGGFPLAASMLAVPVVSAMLASVGFSLKRKLVYAATTVGLYMLSGIAGGVSGLHEAAAQQFNAAGAFPPLWVGLYVAWLTTFPLVMLVLFVGRTPSLLWSRET